MRGLDSLHAFRADHPPATVSIGGREWRYIASQADASAPALVMLPGAFGAAELFWNQITDLGDRLRIVAATYPPADDVGLLADDVAGLMDHLGARLGQPLGHVTRRLYRAALRRAPRGAHRDAVPRQLAEQDRSARARLRSRGDRGADGR